MDERIDFCAKSWKVWKAFGLEGSAIFFIVLGVLAVASAVFTISAKNPVASAIGLIFHFFMLSGLYLTLQAQFIAAAQVLVYAGAIMVLVVFVVMLLNLGDEEKLHEKSTMRRVFSVALAVALLTQIGGAVISLPQYRTHLAANSAAQGSPEGIADVLFTNYVVPFEAIGILLTAAIVGAVVLAKKRID